MAPPLLPYWTSKLQIWSFHVNLALYCSFSWENAVNVFIIPLADSKCFSVAQYQSPSRTVKLVYVVDIYEETLMASEECFFRKRFFHIVQNGGKGTHILRPYRMNNYLMKTAFQI